MRLFWFIFLLHASLLVCCPVSAPPLSSLSRIFPPSVLLPSAYFPCYVHIYHSSATCSSFILITWLNHFANESCFCNFLVRFPTPHLLTTGAYFIVLVLVFILPGQFDRLLLYISVGHLKMILPELPETKGPRKTFVVA